MIIPTFLAPAALAEETAKEISACTISLQSRLPLQLSHSLQVGFQSVTVRSKPSPGTAHPRIEEARRLRLFDDYKFLSDLRERAGIDASTVEIVTADPAGFLRTYIEKNFDSGNELLDVSDSILGHRRVLENGTPAQAATFDHIEQTWKKLVRRTPAESSGSLIPLPYPVLIPGSRFQECYYWDNYFGVEALLRLGRWDLAAMQVENFLFAIEKYGLVPNGMRDYYLTRSQPPLLSKMVRDVVTRALSFGHTRAEMTEWLRERAYPLLKSDYLKFWMNPATRFDSESGLNHYWDAKNTPREERHASDREEDLGQTYRDVRAEAESGRDFTDAFGGRASKIASVQLNFLLYGVEKDLAWMARRLGLLQDVMFFEAAAERRLASINRYMWDPRARTFRGYDLETHQQTKIVTPEIFTALWVGAANSRQAEGVRRQLSTLEHAGGLAGSAKVSDKQWDAPNGWPPDQYFAVAGLRRYGYKEDALRLAKKWTEANERIFQRTGSMWERIDVVTGDRPEDKGDKYSTQEGFLFTNSVYVWMMTDVFKHKIGIEP